MDRDLFMYKQNGRVQLILTAYFIAILILCKQMSSVLSSNKLYGRRTSLVARFALVCMGI